jgi:hypothetical protein
MERDDERARADRLERDLAHERAMRADLERRWYIELREAVAAAVPRVRELENELDAIDFYTRANARRDNAIASIAAQVRRTKRENERALLARYGASAPKVKP